MIEVTILMFRGGSPYQWINIIDIISVRLCGKPRSAVLSAAGSNDWFEDKKYLSRDYLVYCVYVWMC